MNHIKTGYLPTWWVFDSRAPKQDPSLAGIYAPLGPQIYASTRKGSKPCNPAASPVHIPRPQEGLHMEPYEGKTVSEEITTLFIVSFLVCCQQNIRCTAIKLEFEAINFIQFSGWSDNPCLQISTFGFPLSRSIYGGITPMMMSPVLWRTNYHFPASHNEHIILKQHLKTIFPLGPFVFFSPGAQWFQWFSCIICSDMPSCQCLPALQAAWSCTSADSSVAVHLIRIINMYINTIRIRTHHNISQQHIPTYQYLITQTYYICKPQPLSLTFSAFFPAETPRLRCDTLDLAERSPGASQWAKPEVKQSTREAWHDSCCLGPFDDTSDIINS